MFEPRESPPPGSQEGNGGAVRDGNQHDDFTTPAADRQVAPFRRAHIPASSMPDTAPYVEPFAVDPLRRHYNLLRITQFIWLATSTLEILLAIRFMLKLIAANPGAGFAQFIYSVTGVFLTPFVGLTGTPSADGSVLEVFTLIAMLVYALLAWGLVRLMWLVFEAPTVE